MKFQAICEINFVVKKENVVGIDYDHTEVKSIYQCGPQNYMLNIRVENIINIHQHLSEKHVMIQIKRRKCRWMSHIICKSIDGKTSEVLEWNLLKAGVD